MKVTVVCLLIQIYLKDVSTMWNYPKTRVIFFVHCLFFFWCHHWVKYMFDETSNFRNGSTSSPGRHITSCSNSKHVRYEGNGSLSVDPNLLERCYTYICIHIPFEWKLLCIMHNWNGTDHHTSGSVHTCQGHQDGQDKLDRLSRHCSLQWQVVISW